MAHLSPQSREKIETCDKRLQRIVDIAIRFFDFMVSEGHRGEEAQNVAFASGASKLRWPNGNHNTKPSIAMDLIPCPPPKTPEEWASVETALRFHLLAGLILGIALCLNIKVRWGGDWNQNNRSSDEKFKDYPHFELYGET